MTAPLRAIASRFWEARFVRFLIVGGLSSLTYAIFAAIILYNTAIAPYIGSAIAYLLAIVPNFLGQKYLTFRSKGAFVLEIPRFAAVQGANLVLSSAIMHIGVVELEWSYNIAILIVVVLIPIISYIAMSLFVFVAKVSRH